MKHLAGDHTQVTLLVPCYVDQLMPEIGIATVQLLERVGCRVRFDPRQTCCGQPAFNAGYLPQARDVAGHLLDLLGPGDEPIVIPSGSCATMCGVFFPELFSQSSRCEMAARMAARVWELSDFLVRKLGISDVGANFPHRVTFHDGCHALRERGTYDSPRRLLRQVRGLDLVEMSEARACCGFGGAFAVKFAPISAAMAEVKCRSALDTGADYLVTGDPSCLMQMRGYIHQQQLPIKALHLAEVLNRR